MTLLDVKGLCKSFGGLRAVRNVSFSVDEGTILGIIGPNGSGKTTIFNLITGLYKPNAGEISFHGKAIGGMAPYHITKAGISRTFQCIRLFQNMTVLENVLVGMHTMLSSSLVEIFEPNVGRDRQKLSKKAMEYLEFTSLTEKLNERAVNLSYGEQRRLEISRALASGPKLLLLDEPTAGMNPQEAATMMQLIQSVKRLGITILLIEHNMKVLMGVSDRVIVMDSGEKIAEGAPEVVQHDPAVISAYLGTE